MIIKIKDFPNYGVDELGNVYSLPRKNKKFKKLKTVKLPNNYLIVNVYNENEVKKYLVHRLVAETFIPNPENKPEVNHLNGNRQDNRVKNLEWCSHIENVRSSIKAGRAWQNMKGENNKRSKKICQYDLNGNLLKIWPSTRSIEYELNYGHQNIIRACKNNLIRYNFKWKYYEGVETNRDECNDVR